MTLQNGKAAVIVRTGVMDNLYIQYSLMTWDGIETDKKPLPEKFWWIGEERYCDFFPKDYRIKLDELRQYIYSTNIIAFIERIKTISIYIDECLFDVLEW